VEERYHRVDGDHLEMTITIPEEECVPLETEEYNKEFANPAAGIGTAK
jgi:hypothetical protein